MMLKKTVIFKIRIVYKSGYTHDFECTSFSIKDGTYTWNTYAYKNRPVDLGADEIAAVWQFGSRTKYSLF
jgi:hypothetical protein